MKIYVFEINLETLEIVEDEYEFEELDRIGDDSELERAICGLDEVIYNDSGCSDIYSESSISLEDAKRKAGDFCRKMAFAFQVAYQEIGLKEGPTQL